MHGDHPGRSALVHDIARQLALAHQGRLRLDAHGRLLPRAVRLLAEHSVLFGNGVVRTHSQFQSPELGYWVGLLRGGGLLNDARRTLHLTALGRQWLAQPIQAQIGLLRQLWWDNPEWVHLCLPVTRLRDPSPGYWQGVTVNVATWIVSMDSEKWTAASGVHEFLARQGIPTVCDPVSCLPRTQRAIAHRTSRVVSLMMRTVLPSLGLLCIQGEGPNAQVRTTTEGAAWLRGAIARQRNMSQWEERTALELSPPAAHCALPLKSRRQVRVDAHLRITVQPAAPASLTFDLAHFSRLLPCHGLAGRYEITRQTLEQGIRWGYSVPVVGFWLARVTAGHLPRKVAERLMQWQDELALVVCEPGYRLRSPAPMVLEELRRRRPFSERTQILASGQEAWVAQTNFAAVTRYLRRRGYAVLTREDTLCARPHREQSTNHAGEAWPALPHILSLPQLLVALRTYQSLREQVPGLAELGLSDLAEALTGALGMEDHAAVERLVASHTALMGKRLAASDAPSSAMNTEKAANGAHDKEVDAKEGQAEGLGSLVSQLEGAAAQGTAVTLTYVDDQARVTRREVHPLRLEMRAGRHYLIARCALRQAERCFRLDRIVALDDGVEKGPATRR